MGEQVPEHDPDLGDPEHRLIHRDCASPTDEFEGQLGRLIREARHHERQPVDDDELLSLLEGAADDLAERAGFEPRPRPADMADERAALGRVLAFVATEGASAYVADDAPLWADVETLRAAFDLDGERSPPPREAVVLCDACRWQGDSHTPTPGATCPVCGEGEMARYVRAGGD